MDKQEILNYISDLVELKVEDISKFYHSSNTLYKFEGIIQDLEQLKEFKKYILENLK